MKKKSVRWAGHIALIVKMRQLYTGSVVILEGKRTYVVGRIILKWMLKEQDPVLSGFRKARANLVRPSMYHILRKSVPRNLCVRWICVCGSVVLRGKQLENRLYTVVL
jgi:hypothetical protein